MRRRFVVTLLAMIGCCAALKTQSATAAIVKLNEQLGDDSFVFEVRFNPQGDQIAFVASTQINSAPELYTLPAGGGVPVKLSGEVLPGRTGTNTFRYSSAGDQLLYLASEESINVYELYAVPSNGGGATKISQPLAPNGTVFGMGTFSHDGSHALYLASENSTQLPELYIAATNGGGTLKLNTPLPLGVVNSPAIHEEFRFSPDDSQVLFVGQLDTPEVQEVYIVPSVGGTPTKLSGPMVGGSSFVPNATFSANGNYVLYTAEQDTPGVRELYAVSATGGIPLKLNAPLVTGGTLDGEFWLTPDGNDVLYIADQEVDGENELYIVPVTGGTPMKLNGALWPTGDVDDDGIAFSPDGNYITFIAEVNGVSTAELFIVPRTGGTPLKLNGPLVSGGDVKDSDPATQFTKDGSRVVYAADQDTDGITELFSVPVNGGTAVKLSGQLAAEQDVVPSSVLHSPDGARLAYEVDSATDGRRDLYISPVDGGTPVNLSGPLAAGKAAELIEFNQDGSRVLFKVVDQSFSDRGDIFSRVVKQRLTATQGHWASPENWEHGEAPDAVMHVVIDSPSVLRGGTESSVAMIDLGGGTGTATIELGSSDEINSSNRFAIKNRGVVRGGGRVNANVVVESGGEVRASGRDRLRFSGDTFINEGRVEAIGTAVDVAEIEFDAEVTNGADTGLITGSHAQLRFNQGLTNAGSLVLTVGESHVFGDVVNTGRIVVTGGSAVTFYDDIVQNGILTISKVGSTSSAAIFLGDVSGSGTMGGGGDVFLEGDLRPGNSPGSISFDNNIFLGAGTNVDIEIAGLTPGVTFDKVSVNGELALDGTLNAALIDTGSGAFLPEGNTSFEIIPASGGITDGFADVNLPGPRGGISWDIELASGSVTLVTSGARGDYNYDGAVDAADYVVWRRAVGSHLAAADGNGDGIVDIADSLVWRSKFGTVAGSGAAISGGGVPEPSSLVIALITFAVGAALCPVRLRVAVNRGW